MATAGLIIWPTLATIGALGLYAIAPRHTPGLYLLPVARTVVLITLAVIYVAAIWSHS
ncbi:hypothetical protein [Streptomyces phaeochromogenes]|uniref:hypothetical protein n=1 Tax=Streptomyces phaeochromogenes TaxID=1923 RepID=UPI00386ACA1B|nr:hypothetical protein OG277_29120 [Streptomyces phaeochromogenes]